MKKIRVGILGCANIAERYAIPAFKSLPTVELVAIASREESKAAEWAARHAIDVETYMSLVVRDDIDVIYSPLPVGLQEEWVLKAAQNGKHVICEKSITASLASAMRMVKACEDANVALYEQILSLIKDGKIGIPRVWNGAYGFPPFPEGDIRYSADLLGGVLNDCGCYTVFMARKIMQQEPVAVTCVLQNDGNDVDIAGSALLEFKEGTALMSFGFDHLYQNTYAVWGSRGMVRTSRAFAIPPTLAPEVELITNDSKTERREEIAVPTANQFALSFDFFCNAVALHDEARFKDMYDRIIRQARTLEAMRTSAREGRRTLI
jgi:dTDP-3,4-didehydro-2,6-dideoxy-alpha-D-glucose 3-reductase